MDWIEDGMVDLVWLQENTKGLKRGKVAQELRVL